MDVDYAKQVVAIINRLRDNDGTGDIYKIRQSLFDRLNQRNCEIGQLVVLYDQEIKKHVAIMNTQLNWNYKQNSDLHILSILLQLSKVQLT